MSDRQDAAPRRPMEHIDPETIAAWLDEPDDLSADERAVIEEHISGCGECQQVAAQLRALVASLSALPEAALPRSFALGPEHARPAPAPAPAARRAPTPIRATSKWYDRQMRALRWATAAAAILFVFVLGLDLVTTRIDRPASDNFEAAMSSQPTPASGGAAPAAATETTPETMAAKAAPEETPTPAAAVAAAASPEATTAGAEAQPTPAAAQTESGATTAADAAGSAEAIGGEPERQSSETRPVSRREERLRLIEFGLATLFVWLLAMMIALPRLRRRRGNRS